MSGTEPTGEHDPVSAGAARAMASVSLRDEEITLGPLLPEDLGAVFLWLNDVDAARLDLAFRPTDSESFRRWLDQLAQDKTQVLFTVRLLSAPKPIGFVLFKNIHPIHHSAELGLRIGEERLRGKGYGYRATVLALAYAWATLNLHRVHLTTFAHNVRAIACYRRAGFVEEGVMRHASFIDGKWIDVLMMAALRPGGACSVSVSQRHLRPLR